MDPLASVHFALLGLISHLKQHALPATREIPAFKCFPIALLQGRRHGTGSVFLPNGDRFVGSWKEGRLAGPVEYSFAEDSPWANPDL